MTLCGVQPRTVNYSAQKLIQKVKQNLVIYTSFQ